ncbi:MAG: hypothetical protein QW819_00125 [Candidatus Korarchaeota archaeon]|nr:hypothetical protein [Thermoproteota archaeon]
MSFWQLIMHLRVFRWATVRHRVALSETPRIIITVRYCHNIFYIYKAHKERPADKLDEFI